MAIKNVVFDIGNVIVKWAPAEISALTFGETEQAKERAKLLFHSEIWRDLNKGHYTEQQAQVKFHHTLGIEPAELETLFHYIKATQQLIDGTQVLMDDLLSAGYTLFALTDNVNEIVAHLKATYDFWPKFTGAVVSSECGLLKPDPRIYQHLAQSQNIVPHESVFMDDMPANVQGAIEQGFHAFQFATAQDARARLHALGLAF
ncbi:HAD family hydrolase [Vibrio furnissii]|uniref:HAD family hydrolase n=1 Tax=Vibrio furnissii TaxID=29494 RepID=UPI003749D8A9